MPHYQSPNPFPASPHYSVTAFDSQQSDSFPYPLKDGRFEVDLTSLPRVLGGPVNITCLASARPGRMWAMSTDRVTLVDITAGRFGPLAACRCPGSIPSPTPGRAGRHRAVDRGADHRPGHPAVRDTPRVQDVQWPVHRVGLR